MNAPAADDPEITELLQAMSGGDAQALGRLVPRVYEHLRRLARQRLAGERAGHTLDTTGLVHEAYLRLTGAGRVEWKDRGHFFAIAARLMRRILIDHARHRTRHKRGGNAVPEELDPSIPTPPLAVDAVEVLDLDRALTRLEALDPDQACIVELRFFGGLTVEETAAALAVSPATVKREWAIAKGWLHRELSGAGRRAASF